MLGLQTCTMAAARAVQVIRLRVWYFLGKHSSNPATPLVLCFVSLISQPGNYALASMNACLKIPFFSQQKTWLHLLLSNTQDKGVRFKISPRVGRKGVMEQDANACLLELCSAYCSACASGKSHPIFLSKPVVSSTELSKSLPNKGLPV